MARRSIGRVKAAEETIVVCPKCGGREFKYVNQIAAVNVYCTETDVQELRYLYSIVSTSQNTHRDQILTCKSCHLELRLAADKVFSP